MIINHNLNSMNAHRNMSVNTMNSGKAMEKLSSGLRINRAGDDAAGLAISEKMRGQIRGLDQATRNAQDGISLIQTAEGALTETHSILQRMRELAVQSSNDTNVAADRESVQREVDQLIEEIGRIATTTEFNTKKLLDGNAQDVTFQIGSNSNQTLNFNIANMQASTIGTGTTKWADIGMTATVLGAGNLSTLTINDLKSRPATTGTAATPAFKGGFASRDFAQAAITIVNNAIEQVSAERSSLGARQNRLEHTINNLNVGAENLQAAESRVRDVDMAKEMMNFTKNNILNQASQAMLAQANQQPQAVLQLLR